MRKWAWGEISAVSVQELAAASVKAGVTDPHVRQLASLGAQGNSPQNCHRDVLRKSLPEVCAPAPHVLQASVLMKSPEESGDKNIT